MSTPFVSGLLIDCFPSSKYSTLVSIFIQLFVLLSYGMRDACVLGSKSWDWAAQCSIS